MRDLDRWKDKVEISLDGRQIFFLFFGSAVAACLIFVVGVLIGKRIEARALALQPAPIEDPLAALDQLGDASDSDDGLTFHKALSPPAVAAGRDKQDKPDKKADKASDKSAKPDKPGAADKSSGAADKAAAFAEKLELGERIERSDKGEPAAKSERVAAADKLGDKLSVDPPIDEPAPPREAKVEIKVDGKRPPIKVAGPLPPAKPQVVAQAAPAAGKTAAAGAKKQDPSASHFTLQLSAFPDKSDAEEFMHKIQAAGYKPFLVASEIPGKGVFYRVRVGDYVSRQAAVDAKSEFERKQRIIAYVAKL
jgi:cell division septation protein DedD